MKTRTVCLCVGNIFPPQFRWILGDPDLISTDLKLDKLTNLILTLKNDSESKMETLLTSFDKLFATNKNLETRITELEKRLSYFESTSIKSNIPSLTNNSNNNNNNSNNTLSSNNTSSNNISSNNNFSNNNSTNNNPTNNFSTTHTTTSNTNNTNNTNTNNTLPSWATIAKSSQNTNSSLANAKARENLIKQKRTKLISNLSKLAKPRLNSQTETKSIYVGGFDFVKLRVIWKALYEAKFQTSRIVNIQWIGRTVVDIVVTSDYHLQFVSELSQNRQFRILNFNPSYNSKAISPEANETAMRKFSIRCIKNILNTSNSTMCINHFKSLADQYCRGNPDLSKIFDEEWNRAQEALSTQTQLRSDKISNDIDLLENRSINDKNQDVNGTMDIDSDSHIISKPAYVVSNDKYEIENETMDIDSELHFISKPDHVVSESAVAASTLEDGNSDN